MIDVIFSLSAADMGYQSAIGSWLPVVKGNLFAHVTVSKVNEDKLPDIIDWLLDHDIRPLVSQTEETNGLWALMLLVSFTELTAPHVLLIRPGVILVRAKGWIDDLSGFIDNHRDIVTIDILAQDTLSNDMLMRIDSCPLRATLLRARDLYVSTHIALTNGLQYDNLGSVLSTFGRVPYKHLAINPSVLLCS